LGDFAMGSKDILAGTVARLNGRKLLVGGNHDRSHNTMRSAGFEAAVNHMTLVVDGVRLYLRHRPIREKKAWQHLGDFHLCGHVHEKWRRRGNVINVGVDQWDFTPRTLDELLAAQDEGPFTSDEDVR
jgi:calcineurin-like phosphoesterase family protein